MFDGADRASCGSVGVSAVIVTDGRRASIPGDVLRSARGSAEYVRSSIAAAQVGEWTEGRLTFNDAGLDEVATELGRATGIAFRPAPGVTARLSGSIVVAPVREDPRLAGALLGIAVRRQGDAWVIGAP